MFGKSARFTTWEEAMRASVCPSGAAFATASVPMMPEAPGRFSTTPGWPSRGRSRSATSRAVMSLAPPAV